MYQDKKLQIINVFNSESSYNENKDSLGEDEISLVNSDYSLIVTQSSSESITELSPENICIETSGSITLNFESADSLHVSKKLILLKANGATTLNINGAVWTDSQPTWGALGSILILEILFINGQVLLKVFYNSQN